MELLVFGGTGFLGSEIARQAVARGDEVTCLARGRSGPAVPGVSFVAADRSKSGAYADVRGRTWDAVIELSWQPGLVREALREVSDRAGHWLYVSSVSAYAEHEVAHADESAALLPASDQDTVDLTAYGEAKVACEQLTQQARGASMLIARAGLIGGPGDVSDRSGYWVARAARDPQAPMLVPAQDASASQVIDVRDLAGWLLHCAQAPVTGIFDAVGPSVSLHEWITQSRRAGGHTGDVYAASAEWLEQQGVGQFMGAESMAMWVDESAGMYGWSRRSGAAAVANGLRHRDRIDVIRDVLQWEIGQGLTRTRRAGLSASREAALIADLRALA